MNNTIQHSFDSTMYFTRTIGTATAQKYVILDTLAGKRWDLAPESKWFDHRMCLMIEYSNGASNYYGISRLCDECAVLVNGKELAILRDVLLIVYDDLDRDTRMKWEIEEYLNKH